jgi:hypothetical protein
MLQDEERILEWLRKNPDLLMRVGKLKDVAQSGPEQMNRIDLAEGEVIREVDAIGREILSQWAAQTDGSKLSALRRRSRRTVKKTMMEPSGPVEVRRGFGRVQSFDCHIYWRGSDRGRFVLR